MKRSVAFLLFTTPLLLDGCVAVPIAAGAFAGYSATKEQSIGRKISPDEVNKIKVERTTREEVINLFGSPDDTQRLSSGETVFTYTYQEIGSTLSHLIKRNQQYNSGRLMVTFGSNGKVKDVVSSFK